MKIVIIVIIACFASNTIYSQNFPKNDNGDIEFTEVVETLLNKDILYANSKEWVAKAFGDYKSVLQFEDNENCKLIIKGISDVAYASLMTETATKEKVSYTITIESKDGKYRYKIDNILVKPTTLAIYTGWTPGEPFSPMVHKQNIENLNKSVNNLHAIATSGMKKKALNEHNEIISDLEKRISDELTFFSKEYEAIVGIINSLKNAMQTNNNF